MTATKGKATQTRLTVGVESKRSRFDFLTFGFRTESNFPFRSREHVGVFEVRALVLVSSFKFLLSFAGGSSRRAEHILGVCVGRAMWCVTGVRKFCSHSRRPADLCFCVAFHPEPYDSPSPPHFKPLGPSPPLIAYFTPSQSRPLGDVRAPSTIIPAQSPSAHSPSYHGRPQNLNTSS